VRDLLLLMLILAQSLAQAQAIESPSDLPAIFQRQLAADDLREQIKSLKKDLKRLESTPSARGGSPSIGQINEIKEKISKLESLLTEISQPVVLDLNTISPWTNPTVQGMTELSNAFSFNSRGENMSFRESFTLKNASDYDAALNRTHALTSASAHNYELRLVNQLPEIDSLDLDNSKSTTQPAIKAELTCDSNFDFSESFVFQRKNIKKVKFNWYNSSGNGQNAMLESHGQLNECLLRFTDPGESNFKYQVRFKKEEDVYPQLASLTQRVETCLLSDSSKADPIGLFLSATNRHLSCPSPNLKIRPLKNPYVALNTKIKALLGQTIPVDVLDTKDAEYKMDFSKAPKLDVIFVSSLNFKNDYYGRVIADLVKFHALRGTPVRILLAEPTIREKDDKLHRELESFSSNIKFLRYEFTDSSKNLGTYINSLHRVNHTKLFITYSETSKEANTVITGGRNIRDSYLFRSAPNYSKFQDFIQYSDKEEPFIYYEDMEVKIDDPVFTKQVLTQALSLFAMSYPVQKIRPTQVQVTVSGTDQELRKNILARIEDGIFARHIVSVPYTDSQDLESFFVDLFSSAQKRIKIVSPYFRPTAKIMTAIENARARGIDIWILTRINLAGDDIPKIVGDVNKEFVNKVYDKAHVYEWADKESIMHSKFIIIDDTLTFVGGVNLNGRSFIHDLEGGVLVLGKSFNASMNKIYEEYLEGSNHITQPMPVSRINSRLIDIADYFF
jgi:cardiolipin synthase A/B